jgi:hypothetical protein
VKQAPVVVLHVVQFVHDTHDDAPAAECVSAGQVLHVEFPPMEYVPTVHNLQVPDESPRPGAHVRHVPLVALHVVQLVHIVHVTDPLDGVNLPILQVVHVVLPPIE